MRLIHVRRGSRAHRKQSMAGASLIEVLVSIAIASIALLALAGVNAASVRYTKMSQYRATATQLANDIGERMRANKGASSTPTGFFNGDYDLAIDFGGQATPPSLPAQTCSLATSNCTPAQIAAFDLAQWRQLVRDQLPQGSVYMIRQPAQVAMDVWIVWRDPAVASGESLSPVGECPAGLNRNDAAEPESIRCTFFRINL